MSEDSTKKINELLARIEVLENAKKFSFHIFFINITSRKFWVWLLSSYFVRDVLVKNGDIDYFWPLIIIWGIISVIYLIGDPIEKGIGAMFENAKLSAEIKAGANINGGGK